MAEKSVIIIGAGIAGLSAGIYAQMNGYKTQIYENGHKTGRIMHQLGTQRLHH